MEENKNSEEKNQSFKAVQNPSNYQTSYTAEGNTKSRIGFGRSVVLPFFSGVVGCALVVGTCFGFLIYNFHKAKVMMGDTGSLLLRRSYFLYGNLFANTSIFIDYCNYTCS